MRDYTSQDLTRFNTLGLVSHADQYFRLESEAALPQLSALQAAAGLRFYVLGGGSNLVLRQRLSRPIVHNVLKGIRLLAQTDSDYLVEAAGGEVWHDFVNHCVEQGWFGLENLALIPGTVGASPVQNIGAYGVEVGALIDSVQAWDIGQGSTRIFSREECDFAYRDSIFKKPAGAAYLITAVRFRLPKQWQPVLGYPDLRNDAQLAQAPTARGVFDAVCRIRQAKLPDPAKIGNAGSFFKNPIVTAAKQAALLAGNPGMVSYPQADGGYKLAAGWMIEQCGWKGRSLGPVGMHHRQALVLVNQGGATAVDVLALADAVTASVQARFGVALEREPVLFD